MSCSGVAAGAVVQVSNGQRFQHVHIMKEMSMASQTGLQSTLVAAMLLPSGAAAATSWPTRHTMDRFDADPPLTDV